MALVGGLVLTEDFEFFVPLSELSLNNLLALGYRSGIQFPRR